MPQPHKLGGAKEAGRDHADVLCGLRSAWHYPRRLNVLGYDSQSRHRQLEAEGAELICASRDCECSRMSATAFTVLLLRPPSQTKKNVEGTGYCEQ
jgi:hypothetical protein